MNAMQRRLIDHLMEASRGNVAPDLDLLRRAAFIIRGHGEMYEKLRKDLKYLASSRDVDGFLEAWDK